MREVGPVGSEVIAKRYLWNGERARPILRGERANARGTDKRRALGRGKRVRTLHLLRHGKSSWKDGALDDHDRPLSKRGRRAAAVLADHLARSGLAPDLVLCSSALRARQTFDLIARALKPPRVIVERALYEAGPRRLLRYLRELPESAQCVLLVGHNPALHELALTLADTPSRSRLASA